MASTGQDDVEDAVIQAIGHYERRNIIKIIGAAPMGVTYSGILGETGLNTGHLNYHLRGLEGLVERDAGRLYWLTPLGLKALRLLASIGEDMDNGDTPYLKTVMTAQSSSPLHPLVRGFFTYLVIVESFGLLASLWLLGNGLLLGALNKVIAGALISVICGALMYLHLDARKAAPEHLRRLERRFLK